MVGRATPLNLPVHSQMTISCTLIGKKIDPGSEIDDLVGRLCQEPLKAAAFAGRGINSFLLPATAPRTPFEAVFPKARVAHQKEDWIIDPLNAD